MQAFVQGEFPSSAFFLVENTPKRSPLSKRSVFSIVSRVVFSDRSVGIG